MKKITICFMATCLSLTFLPLSSIAADVVPTEMVTGKPPADGEAIIARLNEIKAMDMSNLSSSEKKDLRKEVRSLKHDLKRTGNGVYISIGAAIIIVLLLVILL